MTPALNLVPAPVWSRISRYRASGIHLGVSALIGASALALMLAYWFPAPLFDAMGGKQLILLIVGIDVCIGPLITLIIFDTRKKELLFDLAMIATLQAAALAYGVYAMSAGRPVFVVFVENHFIVVSAAELESEAIEKATHAEFRSLSLTGPVWVAADMPSDIQEHNDIVFAGLFGLGVQNQPKYYVPYADRRTQVLAASIPLEFSPNLPAEFVATINRILSDSGHRRDGVRFLAVETKQAKLSALIDGTTGTVLGLAAVDPLTLSAAQRSAE